ncbi:AraC family transcriptional regulator [Nocardioides bruguierae]|uniref:AraC family transcriptional regulator n=1 Tax=Nocardioides bruguierae TaxID=2945102 RepID=A0A9X2IGW8_9ACTN|nr:AraC family transcriptional regulator [Nocardioides bruguierae]MCM0621205.1 AraC family transcriptional regulator [Nocardioides bruguierae]
MPDRPRPDAPDWGRASEAVAQVYFPHRLQVLGGGPEPRLTLASLDLGPVVVGQVGWGADVAIECDYPDSYEVNLPLTGHLESTARHGTLTSLPGQATVFRADVPSRISHWDATCTVLGVKVDAGWFEAQAETVLGIDRMHLRGLLPDQLALDTGSGRAWRQLALSLAAHLREPALFAQAEVVRAQLAGALASGLLMSVFPDGATAAVHAGPAQPRHVRRVVDALHDDPARAWTAAAMAEVAGVSVRRLQEAFRTWLGTTPTDYLVEVRLVRAAADLRADPAATVSDVAARWGFSSASRFAAAHRRRYGCSPSQARA